MTLTIETSEVVYHRQSKEVILQLKKRETLICKTSFYETLRHFKTKSRVKVGD